MCVCVVSWYLLNKPKHGMPVLHSVKWDSFRGGWRIQCVFFFISFFASLFFRNGLFANPPWNQLNNNRSQMKIIITVTIIRPTSSPSSRYAGYYTLDYTSKLCTMGRARKAKWKKKNERKKNRAGETKAAIVANSKATNHQQWFGAVSVGERMNELDNLEIGIVHLLAIAAAMVVMLLGAANAVEQSTAWQ